MSETKTITVTALSEVRTSKKGNEYFTLEDEQQKGYVCYIPSLRSRLEIGTNATIEFEPKEGDSSQLANVIVDGKEVYTPPAKAKQGGGRQYGKSTQEIASIERQVGVMELGRAMCAGIFPLKSILGSVWELKVLDMIGGQVETSTVQEVKGSEAKPLKESRQAGTKDDTVPVANARSLMEWAAPHMDKEGKPCNPSWVREKLGLENVVITDEQAVEAYNTLKEKMKWQ